MKAWWTARELAGRPGLPATKRGVNIVANREGWRWRDRTGRGGGREYHIDSLPAETRRVLAAEWASKQAAAVPDLVDESGAEAAKTNEAALAAFNRLPSYKRTRARARKVLLDTCATYIEGAGLQDRIGEDLFGAEYSAGRIEAAPWVREALPRIERAAICRWKAKYRQQGIHGLADGYGNRRGGSKIESSPELSQIILGCMAKQPEIRPGQVREFLDAKHCELIQRCSLKGIQRFMRRWKEEHAQEWCRATNPDAWKSRYQAAFGDAAENIIRLNQLWELDSTPADVLLTDGRHSIIGSIDIYSRRLKLLVSRTSKAVAVGAVFRRSALDWGVSQAIRTDQGADYTSHYFMEVLEALRVEQILCTPFASEQKPFIERAFRTFSHGLLELKPGFIGHSVADRKVIEARKSFADRMMKRGQVVEIKMSAAELQGFCDDWCDAVYAHNAHDGLNGKTPFQMAAEWDGGIRCIEDERALDMLLAEAPGGGARSVTKKGIRLEKAGFIHADLTPHIGERVKVRLDPTDLGRVVVYDQTGETFICVAVCPERCGIPRAKAAAVAKKRQKEFLKESREALKEAKKALKNEDIAEAILEHRREQASHLAHFPQKSVSHTTPALDAAAVAARALESADRAGGAPPAVPADAENAAAKRGAEVIALFEEEDRRRQEARRRDEELWPLYWAYKNGELPISDETARWMRSYEQCSEFRSGLEVASLGGPRFEQMQPKKKAPGATGA